jgi:hypothetical protein
VFPFLFILTIISSFLLFLIFSHCNWVEIVSHCSFDFHFFNDYSCWTFKKYYLYIYVAICIFSFEKCLFRSFDHCYFLFFWQCWVLTSGSWTCCAHPLPLETHLQLLPYLSWITCSFVVQLFKFLTVVSGDLRQMSEYPIPPWRALWFLHSEKELQVFIPASWGCVVNLHFCILKKPYRVW